MSQNDNQKTVECQWCNSKDTYRSGFSPMCIETQYRCNKCKGETWEC